jgi:hypothetical protein
MRFRIALSLVSLLALATTASAQFTFTTAEGKTIRSTKAPDVRIVRGMLKQESYFSWEKDHLRIYFISKNGDDPIDVFEDTRLYFADFKPTNVRQSEYDGLFICNIKFPEGSGVPSYSHSPKSVLGEMVRTVMVTFPDKKQLGAFVETLTEKALEMSLDLDYTPPARLVIAGKYRYPPVATPAPAPEPPAAPKPKKLSEIVVILRNESREEIKVQYQRSATADSSRNINIPAGGQREVDSVIGGQIYWRQKPGEKKSLAERLVLTITESMHKTRVLIAK